jgi:hypothetical protein
MSAHRIKQRAAGADRFGHFAGLPAVKFRGRATEDGREPAQVYGSTRIEPAWTVIPVPITVRQSGGEG